MISKVISKTINILFVLCHVWIAVVVLFFNDLPIPDWVRNHFLISNYILLMLGIVFSFIIYTLAGKMRFSISKITLAITLIVIVGTYFCYFKTGWDAGVVTDKAWNAAFNGEIDVPEGYYSFYTNNILIHCFEYGIFKLCILVGISELEYAMYVLVLINCLISATTAILVYDMLLILYPTSKRVAYLGYFFYLGLVMISPWVLIVYTDSLPLVLPILMVWLYVKEKNNDQPTLVSIAYEVLICFLGFMAYQLKATAGVVLIAIIITEIMSCFRELKDAKRSALKKAITLLVIVCIMYFVTKWMFVHVYTACGLVIDDERACPVTHVLKTGFNDAEAGTFNYPDADETAYIPLYKDRYENDLSKAKSRIKALLPFGMIRFQARKTLVNYHDGTFANGVEGGFYSTIYPDRDKYLSPLLKNIFWTDGRYYPYLECVFQALWLVVLLIGIGFGGGHDGDIEFLIKLILIGVFVFLSIFESRARYLYIFSPLFIVAFAGGCERIMVKWRNHFG